MFIHSKVESVQSRLQTEQHIWKLIMTQRSCNLLFSVSPKQTKSNKQKPVVKTCGSCVLISTVSLTVIFVVFHSLGSHHSHTHQISPYSQHSLPLCRSALAWLRKKYTTYFPAKTTSGVLNGSLSWWNWLTSVSSHGHVIKQGVEWTHSVHVCVSESRFWGKMLIEPSAFYKKCVVINTLVRSSLKLLTRQWPQKLKADRAMTLAVMSGLYCTGSEK